MIEQRAGLLFRLGKLKRDFRQSLGREATAVAFVIDLQTDDILCLGDEDAMPGFVKGAPLEKALRERASILDASGQDPSNPPDNSRCLNIVAASNQAEQIGALRESSLAAKRAEAGTIVLAFPACGHQSRKKWDAVMSFAGSKNLPVVFVVHGAWSTEGPGTPDAMRNGIPAIAVDAGDAVAAYRVACEAIARARQGRGPTLVECVTIPDTATSPAGADRIHLQTEGRTSNDPNLIMKDHLKRKGLWSEENYRQLLIDIEKELDLATSFLND